MIESGQGKKARAELEMKSDEMLGQANKFLFLQLQPILQRDEDDADDTAEEDEGEVDELLIELHVFI